MIKSAVAREDPGSVVTRRLEGKIVETVYRGRITAEMAMQVRRDIEPWLLEIKGLEWLIDTSGATSLSPAPREATSGVVDLFRRMGGHRIAAVMPSAPIRMVASALAFATGLPLKIFETRAQALEYLRS